MRAFGLLFIIAGLAIAAFVVYLLLHQSDHVLSPIPQENGVKVIFVTPTPQ